MTSNHFKFLILATLTLISSSCGRDYTTELQEDHIVKLIDQRKYQEVIELVEPHVDSKAHLSPYLAEAHLGLAHFEPIGLARPILAAQVSTNPTLDKVFPRCPNHPLQKFDQISVSCLVKRLIQSLPPSDDAHFARARQLLRTHYPNPVYVPQKYNLLIGAVELASAISRLGELTIYYKNLNVASLDKSQVKTIMSMSEESVNYSIQAVSRARFSGKSITQLLTGLKTVDFLYLVGGDFQFEAGTGMPVLTLLTDSKNKSLETDVLKVLVIQNLDRMIEKLGE
jgi:hypothetical protein